MEIEVETLHTTTAEEDMKIDVQSDCMTLADVQPATAGYIEELDIVRGNPDEVEKSVHERIRWPITIGDVLYHLGVNLLTCLYTLS